MGIETLLRTVEMSPELGVVPPSAKPPHSSIRPAPPRCAASADSTESAQISIVIELFMGPGLASARQRCGLPGDQSPADPRKLKSVVQTELDLSWIRTHAVD